MSWLDDDKFRARKGQLDALTSGDGLCHNLACVIIGFHERVQVRNGSSLKLVIDFAENSRLTSKSTRSVLLQHGSGKKHREESSSREMSKNRYVTFSCVMRDRI